MFENDSHFADYVKIYEQKQNSEQVWSEKKKSSIMPSIIWDNVGFLILGKEKNPPLPIESLGGFESSFTYTAITAS